MNIRWETKAFNDLSAAVLYKIMQLRNAVFVVEQNCPYQDADDKDLHAYHCMGWNNDELVAYTRLIPPGIAYTEASIGRVANASSVRGTGVGKELMKQSLQEVQRLFGIVPVRIGAQLYLLKFYNSLGFSQTGDVYLEDDIEHIEMIRI